MNRSRRLLLQPDGPRVRQLVARNLGKTEDQVRAMFERGDSPERVALVMAMEEVLNEIHR